MFPTYDRRINIQDNFVGDDDASVRASTDHALRSLMIQEITDYNMLYFFEICVMCFV